MANVATIAKVAVPAVLLLGAVWAFGGSGKKTKRKGGGGTGGTHPLPPETPRPESDRMIFDDGCNDLMVRVDTAGYDLRITDYYWTLREEGFNDPEEITVEILALDAPQCVWPPTEDSSLRSKAIWDMVYAAVENYWTLEQEGLLDEFAPIFGTEEEFIE